MNSQIIYGSMQLIQTFFRWFAARQMGGDRAAALEVLRATDLSGYGFSDDVLTGVNMARALVAYLDARGVYVDETLAILQLAEDEERDVTLDEVTAMINTAQVELDETQALIDEMPDDQE